MTLSVRELVLDNSRADILQAAATCFAERGYAQTSIDDVARRLSATKGRIYHHYPSKADLFADVFRTGMDMNHAAVEPHRRSAGSPLDRWRGMARAHVRQMIETKAFQRAVWEGVEMHLRGATTPEQRDELTRLSAYRDEYGNIFRAVLAEGRAQGVFHFEHIGIANQLALMTLNSPIFWYKPRPRESERDVARIVEQVVVCALRGLGAPEEAE
ncbi:MAG: TetR family transcriptional regulator [Rhizobiaceae bacterium]|nr:TetR family transcriptional regulator [Rhizobiaceae bacterium]